ncbi:UNVERIFIED_CONTAM: hypothetical protein K2H54_001668 [Gekko kuhli]
MLQRERTLRLQFGNRIEAVCVVGTHISIDVYGAAPAEALTFSVKHTDGVEVEVLTRDQPEPAPTNGGKQWPLDAKTVLKVWMSRPSTEANDNKAECSGQQAGRQMQGVSISPALPVQPPKESARKTAAPPDPAGISPKFSNLFLLLFLTGDPKLVTVGYYGENGGPPIDQAGVFLTSIGISLDVDADRDGVVEKNNPKKAAWTWGPDGQGAILLVNCDKENPFIAVEDCQDDKVYCKEDLEDMSRMVLRTQGPERLPPGYEMVLYIPMSDSDKVGVFYLQNPFFGQRYIHVLGRRKLFHVVKYTGGSAEMEFFVEGLRFPDDSFNGLVTISVSLLEKLAEHLDCCPALYSVKDNYLFLKEIKSLVSKANCQMKVCSKYMNRSDRWMQDEIEFGYIHAPHKGFPVVLDSPRDGGLQDFAIREILAFVELLFYCSA